jgi:REG-2-like HAD superfamily hydrolase
MKALLLDAAGTLLRPRESVAAVYLRTAAELGITVPPGDATTRWRHAMEQHRALRARDPEWSQYWPRVIEAVTGSAEPDLVARLIDHYAHAGAWSVAEGALELAIDLRARGTKVGVLSNWDRRLRPLLHELGVAAHLDAIVVSAEEGHEKPHPQIFRNACQRLEVQPDRAVHVGDSAEDDVVGARMAGLGAVHFGREVTTFAELAAHLALLRRIPRVDERR